ncbi:hypothetical protein GCM10028820_26010 [Tessaracoccus terricola]
MPVAVHVLRHLSRVLVRAAITSAVLLVTVWFLQAAVAEGVFGLTGAARSGVSRFLENCALAAGVGGLLVPLAVAQFTTYLQHRSIRKVLDRLASEPAAPAQAPVGWQHAAVQRKRAGIGLVLVGIPAILFFGFMAAVGIYVANEQPANWLALTLAIVCPLLVLVGVLMIVVGGRSVVGPARDRWGHLPASVVPRGSRSMHRTVLRTARPPLRRLGLLDSGRHVLLLLAAVGAALVLGLSGAGLLLAGTWVLVTAAGLLVLAACCDAVLAWRLRGALLRQAADPGAPAPPHNQLREVLREEVPRQSALGSLLAVSVIVLVVGSAGIRTGPEYPLGDLQVLFQLLATLGGVGLLLHASAWFSGRSRILDQNDYLARRWAQERT